MLEHAGDVTVRARKRFGDSTEKYRIWIGSSRLELRERSRRASHLCRSYVAAYEARAYSGSISGIAARSFSNAAASILRS